LSGIVSGCRCKQAREIHGRQGGRGKEELTTLDKVLEVELQGGIEQNIDCLDRHVLRKLYTSHKFYNFLTVPCENEVLELEASG
jgi:hypothetical protein